MLLEKKHKTRLRHYRVEIDTSLPGDFRQRYFHPQTVTIRTVRIHRLDHVRDTEDAGFQQDRIALESLRIAGAIEAFMVLQHHLCDRPGEVDAFQNIITCLRMNLD